MPYDTQLEQRIRTYFHIQEIPKLSDKRMFGGIAFMVAGNMACGVLKDYLIVRVGPNRYQAALQQPHAAPFTFSGKPMAGWVTVNPPGLDDEITLRTWIQQGIDFAQSLPEK